VQIGSASNWTQADVCKSNAASRHMINTSGQLWACGYNNLGQLGDGTTTNRSSLVQIGSLTDWRSVANYVGSSVTATKTDGTLWAVGAVWGVTAAGYAPISSPVQIGSDTDWTTNHISTGSHTFAIKTNGTLWSFGYAGTHGVNGRNDTTNRTSPLTQLGTDTNWSQITWSAEGVLAIRT
jgi:alpha-tubulin suppressor-like RCC1 family protein